MEGGENPPLSRNCNEGRFHENPSRFLRAFAYACLFDQKSGRYALLVPLDKKRSVWYFLKPNREVFISQLGAWETEEEAAKWQYIVCPPGVDNCKVTESQTYRPRVASFPLFQSFYKFMEEHKPHYESLYKSGLEKYKNIASLPLNRTPIPPPDAELLLYLPDERTEQGNEHRFDTLMINFSSCFYEFLNATVSSGKFTFIITKGKTGYFLDSKLSKSLQMKLVYQFEHCISCYLEVTQDIMSYLHRTVYTCLFDKQTGTYVILKRLNTEQFLWIFLKPGGQVLVSQLTLTETEAQMKKYSYVTEPPMGKHPVYTAAQPFMPEAHSVEAYGAFILFITKNKDRYKFLFDNAMTLYKASLSQPGRLGDGREVNGKA